MHSTFSDWFGKYNQIWVYQNAVQKKHRRMWEYITRSKYNLIWVYSIKVQKRYRRVWEYIYIYIYYIYMYVYHEKISHIRQIRSPGLNMRRIHPHSRGLKYCSGKNRRQNSWKKTNFIILRKLTNNKYFALHSRALSI